MPTKEIAIAAADQGSFSAYLATPPGGTGPGLVIIQEIFGVNEVMRHIADQYAAAGYVAVVPDLFWRQEPGIQLTDRTDEDWKRAFELYQGFDIDKGITDLNSTLQTLRHLPSCNGRVGSVGFCLGGLLAYLMATRTDTDCSVSYYGVTIDQYLAEAANIHQPLMLHLAEKDQFVSPEAQATIRQALDGHEQVTLHSYGGVDHAFARFGGQTYDDAAATLANGRTEEFLRSHLKG